MKLELKLKLQEIKEKIKGFWQPLSKQQKIMAAGAALFLVLGGIFFTSQGEKAVYAADGQAPITNEEDALLVLDDLPAGRNSLDNLIALENLSLISCPVKGGKFDAAYCKAVPTRLEGMALVLRLTGQEKEALAQSATLGQALPELPAWGRPVAAYAIAHGMVEENMDWLKPLTPAEYVTMLASSLSAQEKEMPLTALQKYRNLTMDRSLLWDMSYHFLCLKEVRLDLKTGFVTSICWGDRLVQQQVISEKDAILADLPILQNDSYRYEKYFTEQLKEKSGLFSFTAKNKTYMNGLMAKPDSYWVLVNKTHLLPESYMPNLITKQTVPTKTQNGLMEPFAYEQLKLLFQGAKEDGVAIFARSGYRSYQTQKGLYGNGSNPYRAKPGTSEHQTGLAMDVVNKANRLDEDLAGSAEAIWLKNHAHEYGFIIRYPKEKEAITGYPAEWWHLRYVGKQIAYTCFVNNWTYDEFYDQCQ